MEAHNTMNPLILFCLILIPIATISDFIPKKYCLYLYIVFVSALAIIIGNEELHIGPDSWNYVTTFSRMKDDNVFRHYLISWEPGTVVWMKLFIKLSDDRHLFWLITIMMSFIPMYYIIWKYSDNPFITLIAFLGLGFLQYPMGILRQWLALQFILLSVDRYFKGEIKRAFAFILVACLFHRTAIIFILFFYTRKNVDLNKSVIFSIALSFFILIGGKIIFAFLNRFARIQMSPTSNGGITMLIVLWISVLLTALLNKNATLDAKNEVFFKLVLIAAVLQPLTLIMSIWSRAISYFTIFLCFLIPGILKRNVSDSGFDILLKNLITEVVLILAFLMTGIPKFIFYSRG